MIHSFDFWIGYEDIVIESESISVVDVKSVRVRLSTSLPQV